MTDDQNPDIGAVATDEVTVPEWVPEKFRTNPEKFGEAYVNLEREFHQTRQELRAQQERLEELVARQADPQPADPAVSQDAIYEAYERDPVGTMAWLAQQAAQQAVQSVTQQQQQSVQPIAETQNQLLAYTANQIVASRVPDWGDYQQRVAEEIQRDPELFPESALASPERAAAALERVYKQVRFEEIHNQNKTLAEQQADLQRQVKLQAQTLSGVPGRPLPTDADKDYWQSVASVPTNKFGS